jgi:hypothetical protein
MPPPNHNNRTISSVNSGHLTSVICGQPTSVLTTSPVTRHSSQKYKIILPMCRVDDNPGFRS